MSYCLCFLCFSDCRNGRLISFFFFKQMTAYELRISDWSSDVCSSDLKRYLIVFGLLLIHSVIVSFIFGSVVYSALIQLSLLFAVMITLRSSATFVTTKDYIRLYLFAALVVAISIILESVIAFKLPGLADAQIYQVLRKNLRPLAMIRAHGLMMETSAVALILPH